MEKKLECGTYWTNIELMADGWTKWKISCGNSLWYKGTERLLHCDDNYRILVIWNEN